MQIQESLATELRIIAQNGVGEGHLIGLSTGDDADETFVGLENLNDAEDRIIKKGEMMTQRTLESSFDSLLSGPLLQYRAAGSTFPRIELAATNSTLLVNEIIWDKIDAVRPPFPSQLSSDWEKATHFLVAIAQYKSKFCASHMGENPYGTRFSRELAF